MDLTEIQHPIEALPAEQQASLAVCPSIRLPAWEARTTVGERPRTPVSCPNGVTRPQQSAIDALNSAKPRQTGCGAAVSCYYQNLIAACA
jgi:hypothetical protein